MRYVLDIKMLLIWEQRSIATFKKRQNLIVNTETQNKKTRIEKVAFEMNFKVHMVWVGAEFSRNTWVKGFLKVENMDKAENCKMG